MSEKENELQNEELLENQEQTPEETVRGILANNIEDLTTGRILFLCSYD